MHKLIGQPVEQFRVTWIFSLRSKILAGLYKTCAKESLPFPIHPDSRGQGIRITDNPLREPESIVARAFRQRRQKCWCGSLNFIRRAIVFTASQNEGFSRRRFFHDHRRRKVGIELHNFCLRIRQSTLRCSNGIICLLAKVLLQLSSLVSTAGLLSKIENGPNIGG